MRLVRRRVPAKGIDHELIWLVVSVTAGLMGLLAFGLGLNWPRCPFLAITGFPCLTCGATRATIAFLHGNFSLAWWWNPLALLALCGVALFDLYAIAVLLSRSARIRMVDWTGVEKNFVRIAVVSMLALNWIYLLSHRDRF
ncbi:MAG: hypothetical protein QOD12_2024 [Verrucomicrobiota bacterium]|jgi:hypothetical protein